MIEPVYATYGRELKKAREAKHFSLAHVAREIGLGSQAVHYWEMGLRRIHFHQVVALAVILDMDLNRWKTLFRPTQVTVTKMDWEKA